MASKPIPLDEAARMLGISPEELTDAHARNEILDVRGTGSVRKFKFEELQRFADEKGITLAAPSSDGGTISFDEGMLGASSSDELVLDDDQMGSSELVLDQDADESRKLEGSSENTGSDVLSGEESEAKDSESDTGKMLGDDDDLLLAEDDLFDEGDLSLSDSGELSLDSDSDLEDSDLVLDEDSSGEMALSADDSGINLSPTDSGLSLDEESVEFEGSDIDALELPEDEDMIEIEGDSIDADAAAQVRTDEDFILTPVEESLDDESSGSQVIDLESSEIYVDESSSGLFEDSTEGSSEEQEPFVAADPAILEPEVGGFGVEHAAIAGGPTVSAVPEAPYSVFNLLSLMGVFFFVLLTSMVAIDLVRNMWQPAGPIAGTLADFILKSVGLSS